MPSILLRALTISLMSYSCLWGCAGPTSPLGPVQPWDLVSRTNEELEAPLLANQAPITVQNSEDERALRNTELEQSLSSAVVSASAVRRSVLISKNRDWQRRIEQQNKDVPWILVNPKHLNYVKSESLRVHIHDPLGISRKFRIRVKYGDRDLTAKLQSRENWQRQSDTDIEYRSLANYDFIRFSARENSQLQISYLPRAPNKVAALKNHWLSVNLEEPSCRLSVTLNPEDVIQKTNDFKVEAATIENLEELSRKFGVNPNLMAGLIAQESGFDSRAVSLAKAIGLTQITPIAEAQVIRSHPEFPRYPNLNKFTFLELISMVRLDGISSDQEWRLDPERSILGGLTYFDSVRQYWSTFISHRYREKNNSSRSLAGKFSPLSEYTRLQLMLASYNSGPMRVKQEFLRDPNNWLAAESLKEARVYVHKVANYCSDFASSVASED